LDGILNRGYKLLSDRGYQVLSPPDVCGTLLPTPIPPIGCPYLRHSKMALHAAFLYPMGGPIGLCFMSAAIATVPLFGIAEHLSDRYSDGSYVTLELRNERKRRRRGAHKPEFDIMHIGVPQISQ